MGHLRQIDQDYLLRRKNREDNWSEPLKLRGQPVYWEVEVKTKVLFQLREFLQNLHIQGKTSKSLSAVRSFDSTLAIHIQRNNTWNPVLYKVIYRTRIISKALHDQLFSYLQFPKLNGFYSYCSLNEYSQSNVLVSRIHSILLITFLFDKPTLIME